MEERELTIEDIKVWPKRLVQRRYGGGSSSNETIELELTSDKGYKIIDAQQHHSKHSVLQWINSNESDRKMFFDAVKKEQFDNEMKEIISEA